MIKSLTEDEKFKIIRPIIGECDYDSYNMPIIKKINMNDIEWENLKIRGAFSISKIKNNKNTLIHMFLKERKLLSIWNNPLKKIALFKTCAAIATPDFSIYPMMNENDIRHNVYMNRWLGCTWQNYGVTVIPTIGWGKSSTFDLCFSAVEKGSIVIISTLGCQYYTEDFLLGFNEMKKRIEPPLIIVFGNMISGMSGKFINFRYTDSFTTDYIQMKLNIISSIFEIKETE